MMARDASLAVPIGCDSNGLVASFRAVFLIDRKLS